jgi:dihydrofolate reductase
VRNGGVLRAWKKPNVGKVRVASIGVSLDGYGAGPAQDLEHPLGVGGEALFAWFFPTRTFRTIHGEDGGETGVDEDFARRGFDNVGAWIVGRNMFGPVRGRWPDDEWKGWWGDDPPFHVPVYVLTHYPRAPIEMQGGTTFHFGGGDIAATLFRAKEAAGEKDVRIGGGVATIRAYLQEGLVDEMHLAVAPTVLGKGERLFEGLDLPALGYAVSASTPGRRATHVMVTKQA